MLIKIFTLIKTGGSFQCIISLLYFTQTNMQKQGRSWWFNFCNFDYQNIYAKSSKRIDFVSWDWIDKNLIRREKLFWEESITILPLHLHFHLVVILPDSTEKLQRQFRLFCENMTREIVLVPRLFCHITTPTGMQYQNWKE